MRGVLILCFAFLVAVGTASSQSAAVHGRWQWIGSGDFPPEVYLVLYLDTDGWERADIGELFEPNLANGTTLRPLFSTHGFVRRMQGRNFILMDYLQLAEFVLLPNGNLVLEWLPRQAGRDLARLGHWPSDDELLGVVSGQRSALDRRLEMSPATKSFPDLN